MAKKLKIASVSAEVAPFSKVGGLGDVANALPKAFAPLGHRTITITPLHGTINPREYKLKKIFEDIEIEIDKKNSLKSSFWKGEIKEGIPIYFVDNKRFFSRRKYVYGHNNENARFLFFDLAALKLIELLNFAPDIVQCHDWHTGLIPYFLKKRFKNHPLLGKAASVYTIHNLAFQAGCGWWEVSKKNRDNGRKKIPPFSSKKKISTINFAKRGIIYSDLVNTVSEQYAKEILTKEFGEGLYKVLQSKNNKKAFFGIINGIDYFEYNPLTDPGLKKNYDVNSIDRMIENKKCIQKRFKLPEKPEIPVVGMVSRITEQKGFDLVMEIMEVLMGLNLQLILVGTGSKHYENFFRKIAKKYPKKLKAHLQFDAKNVTQVYAGSDMFLMPSRFEPCGLGQLISLRYGSIPIVRATGGLVDTVTNFNPKTGKGNGFVFKKYDSRELLVAVVRALETYKYEKVWRKLVKNGMQQSFSWKIPAKKYIQLFRKAIKLKNKEN